MQQESPPVSLPPDLDSVTQMWRDYISQNVEIHMSTDLEKHIEGTHSAYHLSITFEKPEGPLTYHYAGQTGRDPRKRASEHKSEMKTCRITTGVGKSSLYSMKNFGGVKTINMHLAVTTSGHGEDQVLREEQALSDELKGLFGREAVLTQPRGKRLSEVADQQVRS